MYAFDYHRAKDVADAVHLTGKTGGRPLAGGQSLIPALRLRLANPGHVVDLGRIGGLDTIKKEGDAVVIGAMARHVAVATSEVVRRAIPGLAILADGIGDRQVRNRGTLGGSIANNDPAACYPAALLALGATVETERRKISADDFFTGMYETALEADEIITAVSFPIPKKSDYVKFRNPASHFALVGVYVAQRPDGVRVAVTGAGPCVFRAAPLEAALSASFTPAAAKAVVIDENGLNSDLHASAEYRAHLIPVLAARAVGEAW